MADVFDIQVQVASDVNAAVQPLVGTTFALPVGSPDAALFGPTRTIPSIAVLPGNILLEEIMQRLEAGKVQIQVEAETYDLGAPQFLHEEDIEPTTIPIPALAVAVAGLVITISGGIQVGDVVNVQLGSKGAGYAVQATDTLTTIAANLATALNSAGISCTSGGAQVTVTATGHPSASVGTSWNRTREIMRRRKVFFATLYSPTPYDRSWIGKVIETVYPAGTRLMMPDGTLATLVPMNGNPMQSSDFDSQQRDTTWVRRVSWIFDFISTQTIPVVQVVADQINFTSQPPALGWPVGPLTAPTTAQL